MSVGNMPGPAGRSLPPLIQKRSPGDPWNVSTAGSGGFRPKPGILPLPWPCTPYFFPFSDPWVTKSIWSWNGLGQGGASLHVALLLLADEEDDDDAESDTWVGTQPAKVFAGNCRSGSPPQRLGPSAPQ